MFKKHLISLVFIWGILVSGCFWLLYTLSSEAQISYQRLMNDSNDQAKKENRREKSHLTQQARHQVSKQILYKKGLYRMQSRLASDYSDLTYSRKEGELVENFKGLTCAMQEELITALDHEGNQQLIREFKAKEAIYSYKSGQLEGQEVEVAHYLLPEHLWPESFDSIQPLLQGRAKTIQLSLFEEPHMKAEGFQAIFHEWGSE
jgi:hypothetical protein